MYLDCKKKWIYRYVLKEKQRLNKAMLIGSVMHKAIERHLEILKETDIVFCYDEMVHVFNNMFDKLANKNEHLFTEGGTKEMAREWCKRALKEYIDNIAPILNPCALEEKLWHQWNYEGLEINLSGILDIMTRDYFIYDIKTGTSFTQKKVDDMLQLSIYSLLYRQYYGWSEHGIRIISLDTSKDESMIEIFETSRGQEELDGVMEYISNIAHEMRMLEYNGEVDNEEDYKGCNKKHCPYWHLCQYEPTMHICDLCKKKYYK